ncbi:hypothetical protein ES708_25185 [subsurface metagenome]
MATQNLIETYQADNILRGYMTFAKYAAKVMRYADACLREETGFSFIKYMVLHTIAANGGTLTPSEIANRTFRNRNGITILVQRLVRDGLVVSERSDTDKRCVNVTLTDKGRGVLPQVISVVKGIADQVMLSITEADAVELEKLMGVLGQNADDGLDI